MNSDFPTKDQVNKQLISINEKVSIDFVQKYEFRDAKGKLNDRMEEIEENNGQCKKALQNHTKHITKFKKDLELCATKSELRKLADYSR